MDKFNHLNELPIANLTTDQLNLLQKAENSINQVENEDIVLIAFKNRK